MSDETVDLVEEMIDLGIADESLRLIEMIRREVPKNRMSLDLRFQCEKLEGLIFQSSLCP
jgi:hypothetical protein